jgi:putative ABC transport system substrate-binding protein
MRRRELIRLMGLTAATWPLAAGAQAPKTARIGILVPANPEPFWSIFRKAMDGIGYVEGQNVQYEFRSAQGKPQLLRSLADELVGLKVDVIVAYQTPAVTAAKKATTMIPIVMGGAGDPVGTGLIASLAHPGGNITGISGTTNESGAKILEVARDMLAPLRRVGVLANATDPFTPSLLKQVNHGGQVLRIAIEPVMVHDEGDFEAAFGEMTKAHADAVLVQPSLPRKAAAQHAVKHRLPAIGPTSSFADEGGLMSFAADQNELYGIAAHYVGRILKGDKPADLPVEEPTKYLLAINLNTAKALGLTISPVMLARADEVIE